MGIQTINHTARYTVSEYHVVLCDCRWFHRPTFLRGFEQKEGDYDCFYKRAARKFPVCSKSPPLLLPFLYEWSDPRRSFYWLYTPLVAGALSESYVHYGLAGF